MKVVVVSFVVSVVVALASVFVYDSYSKERVAYIRNGVILSEYNYMIDNTKAFEEEVKAVQINIDTLRNRYEKIAYHYKNGTVAEKKSLEPDMKVAEENFVKYSRNAELEIEKKKVESTQKVLTKINDFIKLYAVENKYAMVLGTTSDGSILYGDPEKDITEVILKKLNEEYRSRNEKIGIYSF